MVENIENLILAPLKRFQAGQDRIERKLDEVVRRVSSLEAQVAHLHGDMAAQSSRIDRIERRLDLSEQPA